MPLDASFLGITAARTPLCALGAGLGGCQAGAAGATRAAGSWGRAVQRADPSSELKNTDFTSKATCSSLQLVPIGIHIAEVGGNTRSGGWRAARLLWGWETASCR